MLLGLILKPFFLFINLLISMLGGFFGDVKFIVGGFDIIIDLIAYGVYFMGASTFSLLISSIGFWFTIEMVWAIIEWIYKKIPGVD